MFFDGKQVYIKMTRFLMGENFKVNYEFVSFICKSSPVYSDFCVIVKQQNLQIITKFLSKTYSLITLKKKNRFTFDHRN